MEKRLFVLDGPAQTLEQTYWHESWMRAPNLLDRGIAGPVDEQRLEIPREFAPAYQIKQTIDGSWVLFYNQRGWIKRVMWGDAPFAEYIDTALALYDRHAEESHTDVTGYSVTVEVPVGLKSDLEHVVVCKQEPRLRPVEMILGSDCRPKWWTWRHEVARNCVTGGGVLSGVGPVLFEPHLLREAKDALDYQSKLQGQFGQVHR